MKRSVVFASVLALLFGTGQVAAQAGIRANPCPSPVAMPAEARTLLEAMFMDTRRLGEEDFARLSSNTAFSTYIAAINDDAIQDWPRLCRFRAANDDLLARGVRPRIVFMGDSITENWLLGDPGLFHDGSVNRGIGGQTTAQMLLRFANDVLALQPDIVHILAGTNDVAGNTGPIRAEDVKNNIRAMVTLARANGIAVILGSIPPANSFNWQPAIDPVPHIQALNTWLERYAEEEGLAYIDYFTPLADARRGLRADYGNDGVHPNRAGYTLMRRLLDARLADMQD